MKFEVIEILKRSITVELKNDCCFESDKENTVFLNDKEYVKTKNNVITIDGLKPETEYKIQIDDSEVKSCTTKKESILLDVTRFGAVGDGSHIDTNSLQAAIMACPQDGTVWVKKGTYLTGPLFLKSNMTLWVDEGATILGITDRSVYPVLPGIVRNLYDNSKEYNVASWEGNPLDCFASLITAINCNNVEIVGRGSIDGNASNGDWWINVRQKRTAWRPRLLFLSSCKNIKVQGLRFQNSPSWTIHPYYCDNITFMNINIWNPSDSPNTDGFDPESCNNVLFIGNTVSVGDDCIAIKSGKLYMAEKHYKPICDVKIRNCRFERGHGSVTAGSEIAGGVNNIHISKCLFVKTDRGLRIKTRRGRGQKSYINNILLDNVKMDQVHMPVTVNMFYFCDPDGHSSYVQSQDTAPVDFRTPRIGSISLKNIECTGVDASFVCAYGLPESPIEKISIKDANVSFLNEEQREPKCPIMMEGLDKMSGVSLYIKNTDTLELENVKITGNSNKEPLLFNVTNKLIK